MNPMCSNGPIVGHIDPFGAARTLCAHWVNLGQLGTLWIHWDTLDPFGAARLAVNPLGHIGFIWDS